MSMVAVKIIAGAIYDIYALEQNGRCDLLDYLAELEATMPHELQKLTRLFDRTATSGIVRNEQKFKRLQDKIYEFKTFGGVRVACFFDGAKVIVLTNGFKKPKNYAGEIEKAINLKNSYEACKRNDCLSYRDESDDADLTTT